MTPRTLATLFAGLVAFASIAFANSAHAAGAYCPGAGHRSAHAVPAALSRASPRYSGSRRSGA